MRARRAKRIRQTVCGITSLLGSFSLLVGFLAYAFMHDSGVLEREPVIAFGMIVFMIASGLVAIMSIVVGLER